MTERRLSMTREEYVAAHISFRQAAERGDNRERVKWNQAAMHLSERMRTEARMLDSELGVAALELEMREGYHLSPDEIQGKLTSTGPPLNGAEWYPEMVARFEAHTHATEQGPTSPPTPTATGAKLVDQIHDQITLEVLPGQTAAAVKAVREAVHEDMISRFRVSPGKPGGAPVPMYQTQAGDPLYLDQETGRLGPVPKTDRAVATDVSVGPLELKARQDVARKQSSAVDYEATIKISQSMIDGYAKKDAAATLAWHKAFGPVQSTLGPPRPGEPPKRTNRPDKAQALSPEQLGEALQAAKDGERKRPENIQNMRHYKPTEAEIDALQAGRSLAKLTKTLRGHSHVATPVRECIRPKPLIDQTRLDIEAETKAMEARAKAEAVQTARQWGARK